MAKEDDAMLQKVMKNVQDGWRKSRKRRKERRGKYNLDEMVGLNGDKTRKEKERAEEEGIFAYFSSWNTFFVDFLCPHIKFLFSWYGRFIALDSDDEEGMARRIRRDDNSYDDYSDGTLNTF